VFAKIRSSEPSGSAANTSSDGANTVYVPSPESVSAKPAALIAVSNVV